MRKRSSCQTDCWRHVAIRHHIHLTEKNDSSNNNITIILQKGVIMRQTHTKNKYIFIKQL